MVDPHVRTHHAVEYEMNTATAPEKTIAERRNDRFSAGLKVSTCAVAVDGSGRKVGTHKFLAKLADDQSSTKREKMMRTGIERRLL